MSRAASGPGHLGWKPGDRGKGQGSSAPPAAQAPVMASGLSSATQGVDPTQPRPSCLSIPGGARVAPSPRGEPGVAGEGSASPPWGTPLLTPDSQRAGRAGAELSPAQRGLRGSTSPANRGQQTGGARRQGRHRFSSHLALTSQRPGFIGMTPRHPALYS